MTKDKKQIRFAFNTHGLGDVVHCATAMRLYIDRGYDVAIQVEPNKRWVWEAAGIPIYAGDDPLPIHPYYYPDMNKFWDLSEPDHTYSKIAHLFEVDVLPKLGTKEEVWRMVCEQRIKASVSGQAHDEVSRFLEGLPKPIILLHTKGTNWQAEKSIPDPVAFQLLCELINAFGGSIVTLDWDARAPTLGHKRVRSICPHWDHMSTEQFGALCQLSDLLIGVDSGPFHLAGWFDTPTLFVARKIPPVRCCLPSPNATYLVSTKEHANWATRGPGWRFAEFQGPEATVQDIVVTALEILSLSTRKVMHTMSDLTSEVIPGIYTYKRCGYDERPMELLPDGQIGDGSAGCERTWKLSPTPVGQALIIYGDGEHDTCHLRLSPDGVFRGHWLRHERMPIELTPAIQPNPETVTWDDLTPVEPVSLDTSATPVPTAVVNNLMPTPQLVDCHGVWVRTGYAYHQDLDVVRDVVLNDEYKLALRSSYGDNEVVVDIGGHIGTFAVMWHRKNPKARIICVEACPENIPVLRANVGGFATIIHAACTYEPGELALLNSVKPDGTATGGSTVVPRKDIMSRTAFGHSYWRDLRPLRKVTLEEVMREAGVDHIDVLKMDCEGSEFSILEHSPSIPRIKFMCGEYHGLARWEDLRTRLFSDWNYGHMWSCNDLGIFHIENTKHHSRDDVP